MRPMRQTVAFLLVVVVAGCIGDGGLTGSRGATNTQPTADNQMRSDRPSQSPNRGESLESAQPWARPSLLPTQKLDEPEQESMPTRVTTERNGVRLTLEVGGNPFWAGGRIGVTTTIKNTGNDTLRWMVDGCGTDVYVNAELTDARWRPSTTALSGDLERWRQTFVERSGVDQPISLNIRSGWTLGLRRYGCADLGIGRSLKPGRSKSAELIWDGMTANRLGLPPSGPFDIVATFDGWHRGRRGKQRSIEVRLDSWMTHGIDQTFLSPGEVIDAAFANQEWTDWLLAQPYRNGNSPVLEYDQASGIWLAGLLTYRDDQMPLLHAALIDPITGEVIDIREHPVDL